MDDEQFVYGDFLDERYLIDRAEHEAHAEGNEEEPDDEPFEECGAVAHLPGQPPQNRCCKPKGHEHGPDTDWKRDYHSNGLLKWPVRHAQEVVLPGPAGTSGTMPVDDLRALAGYVEQRDDAARLPLLELIDRYGNEVAGKELGDQHHNVDMLRAEIERRWEMATNTQITGSLESQPGVALVLDILDGRRS